MKAIVDFLNTSKFTYCRCAQDRYLLQNLEYASDTMAGRESHVFKFADKPTLFFSCQIKLMLKDGSSCLVSITFCILQGGHKVR